MKQYLAPIISNQEFMPGIFLMWVECPGIASRVRPGQYIMLNCGEGTFLRRPISVHQTDEDRLALLYSPAGKGTRWLAQRKYGESLDMIGPLGNGFTIYPDSSNLLLLSGGIGIAPLFFLSQQALHQGKNVTLILGACTVTQIYPANLLPTGITPLVATDDGTGGRQASATDLLPESIHKADQVFACGPQAMYRTMAGLQELKGKPIQVTLEMRMACGFGVCYGCTIRTRNGLKQVCKDGPVFNLADIVWDEMFRI